ncbi:MAG: nucleotidyltransferase domain-containing protein [Armatimonadota bacterium]
MKRKSTLSTVPRTKRRRSPAARSTNRIGRSTKAIGEKGWGELFASDTLVALLKVFLLNPENAYYQRELAAAAGTGLFAVQHELARLERLGLVVKTPRGNRVYYRTARGHPAFEDLKRVVVKTFGLGDGLKDALTSLKARVHVAFVYGSYATGQEALESDIDLLLIGSLTSREAASLLGPIGREVGREFNAVVYSPDEFARKCREGQHFIAEVLKGPKTFLIGNQDELARLAGSRTPPSA